MTFTPAGAFKLGSTSFTYTVSDGDGGTAVGNVTVTVPNVPPAAANDTATTPYLGPNTVDVLANDTDVNGDPLTVTAVTGEAHGTAVITGAGVNTKVLYTPAAGWSGPDTMTYTVSDGTTTSTAQLTVTTADAPPTANNFSTTVAGGTPTTVDVVAHASDPNGDTLTVTALGPPVMERSPLAAAVSSTHPTLPMQERIRSATPSMTVTAAPRQRPSRSQSATRPRSRSPTQPSQAHSPGAPVTVDVLANDTDANQRPADAYVGRRGCSWHGSHRRGQGRLHPVSQLQRPRRIHLRHQ